MSSGPRSVFGGGRSVFGDAAEAATVDLNLTPLMDVMSNILFFLLASVGASIVALLPASVPTRAESAPRSDAAADALPQVMVTLQVTATGFVGTAQADKLSAAELTGLRFALPMGPPSAAERWNLPYDDLTQRLWGIKKKYPASDTVVLLPEAEVPYQVIIRAMDAARGVPATEKPVAGVEPANLFTKVVIADLVK